jgi:predicted Fe-Mo cluster-binding NifX family protein
MKIAISAAGPTLEAGVDPRFGRCRHFIIADPETLEFEAIDNAGAAAGGGAGVASAQMIAGQGVEAVMTGNCGPNAYQVLSASGIKVVTGASGTVRDVIEDYKLGKFSAAQQASVPDHFGMGQGRRTGGGRGMGRQNRI